MPVTIKNTKMKYKKSNGNYVGINAVAEQTTAEEVADIQAASITAQGEITNLANNKKTEITDKGNETLASIPQDYTSLSNEVSSLSSAFVQVIGNEELPFSDPELKQYINTSGSTVSWDTPSVSISTKIKWAVVECAEGDIFTITGKGGNSDRLWAFADENKNILSVSKATEQLTQAEIVSPKNTKYLIVNDETNSKSYIGRLSITKTETTNKLLKDSFGLKPINMTAHAFIDTDRNSVDISSYGYNASMRCGVVECSEGDCFTINAHGGSVALAYAFINQSGIVLKRSKENVTLNNYVIYAPTNAKYLIINDSDDLVSYCGRAVLNEIDTIKNDIAESVIIDFTEYGSVNGNINSGNKWNTGANYTSKVIPIDFILGMNVDVITGANQAYISFLTSNTIGNDQADVTTAADNYSQYIRNEVSANSTVKLFIPVGTKYIFVTENSRSSTYLPTSMTINYRPYDIKSLVNNSMVSYNNYEIDLQNCETVSGCISSGKKWMQGAGYSSKIYNASALEKSFIDVKAKSNKDAFISFLTSKLTGADNAPVTTFCSGENGRRTVTAGNTSTFIIPSDCKYVFITYLSSNTSYLPQSVYITGTAERFSVLENEIQNIKDVIATEEIKKAYEPSALRAIASTQSGRDIPQSIAVLNAYKKAHQLLDIAWTALDQFPSTDHPDTPVQAGQITGIPYSSVKEYDKYIGWNVSLLTFMSAVHNPYSLMYTEDVLETHKHSEYGIDYHGTNCGAYFGDVCNTMVMRAVGSPIPWNTAEFAYLENIGKLYRVEDQSATGVRLMDIIWEPGHANIITDIIRDNRGNPVTIYWSEFGPRTTQYTPAQFNERLQRNHGVIYYYTDLYKNLEYEPSEFVPVEDEESITSYTYNDDICTFSGDYACFNDSEDIYINYNAGDYTTLQVYKNDVLLNEESISGSSHKIKITTDGYGLYKARLTNESTSSDYTHFEIVDTTVSCSYEDNNLVVTFSSENGTPLYAQLTYRSGESRGIIPLTAEEILNGKFERNPFDILKAQYPSGGFAQTTYIKVFFRGQYGVTVNKYTDTGIVT